jgi:transketolase
MRNTFSRLITEAALRDGRVRVLMGDHGYALFDMIRERAPEQLINCGVAEQNMIGVAAGLAKGGLVPIAYGLASFVPMRVLEQIRLDVCYEDLPVVIVGDGAGVVYGALGSTHQCFEDVAALRALPNLTIFSPCDEFEMRACFNAALGLPGPAYIRMGKGDVPRIHSEIPELGHRALGRTLELRRDSEAELLFFATGSMVHAALRVAERLAQAGQKVAVHSVPTLKPFNETAFMQTLTAHSKLRGVVAFEEHSRFGGLGSLLAECVTGAPRPLPVLRLGIQDRFSAKCGSWEYLLKEHGLDDESLIAAISQFTFT